jgi:hypothetical protein
MNELLGATIIQVFIDNSEQHYIKFVLDSGEVICYLAEGDCCSESWFADIIGIDALLGQKIERVEDFECYDIPNNRDERTRQEYDAVYKYMLVTRKGYCDIIYRNSSNGYYGGWLKLLQEEPSTDWWYCTSMDPIQWLELTEDYP